MVHFYVAYKKKLFVPFSSAVFIIKQDIFTKTKNKMFIFVYFFNK